MIHVDTNKVSKACRGDSNAFVELMQERKDDIYRLAYTYVKNGDDALDILHDVVYKAFISQRKLKNPEFFNTWLLRITVNCCIDHLKKSKKIAGLEIKYDNPEALEQIADNSQDQGNVISSIDLFNAIDKLSIEQRTVVVLKYYQDLTLSQVAEVLACPLGTVKTRLHKALHSLRGELKEGY